MDLILFSLLRDILYVSRTKCSESLGFHVKSQIFVYLQTWTSITIEVYSNVKLYLCKRISKIRRKSVRSRKMCFRAIRSREAYDSVCVLSNVWLCDPMDCSPPGSSVHGILKARILEWVAMPYSRGSFRPRDQTRLLCLLPCRQILYHWVIREAQVCAWKHKYRHYE